MVEIKCPKCGEVIKLGKDEYNTILNDVEKQEIETRVNERVENLKNTIIAQHQVELIELKSLLEQEKAKQELEINKATEKANKELQEKANELLRQQVMFEQKLQMKDEDIKKWKEFRLGGSTKELGESLEQYCHDAFDEMRSVAYPNAYFEKDNDVDSEGKGDFIFRDYIDGVETVSIMFEMKNQNDTSKNKHKNEDFFAKLDKNRTSKNCEYAVLVSTLEEDSKLYNNGIVDVSHRYPKMYVIRPQFFMTIIGLISTLSKNTYSAKKQLQEYQTSNVDITRFEDSVKSIVERVNGDYEKAGKIYSEVDSMCDDIIKKVNKFRDEFRKAADSIGSAKKKLDGLEIKKLTRGNPTMKKMFENLKETKTNNDGDNEE